VIADFSSTEAPRPQLYDVRPHPSGAGTAARTKLFSEIVNTYFETEYATIQAAPSDLIHVTCTGYAAPSGAQRLVAQKGWGALTRVTHAYHMGCNAAFPAIRVAAGQLGLSRAFASSALTSRARADIVHTELCSLHLDPSDHSAEQCVIQSLFGDGFIRYSLRTSDGAGNHIPGLVLLALAEQILPSSLDSMSWSVADHGMHMGLLRDVPERIAAAVRPFVVELFLKAGLDAGETLTKTVFAIHPGGPKIIDRIVEALELSHAQAKLSREVLHDHGNMSSATLPHIWARIVATPEVSPGTPILSLAFGPGLTVCGGVFLKA
jgi:predicted naringenin-chalcone synthase